MKIGLLSDTHGWLDKQLYSHFKDCDEIWHAGDIGSVDILDMAISMDRISAQGVLRTNILHAKGYVSG